MAIILSDSVMIGTTLCGVEFLIKIATPPKAVLLDLFPIASCYVLRI